MGIFNHHTKAKHSMLSKTHYPQHEAGSFQQHAAGVLLSAAAPGRLVNVEGKVIQQRYIEILLQSVKELQHGTELFSTKTMTPYIKPKRHRSPDFNPFQTLW